MYYAAQIVKLPKTYIYYISVIFVMNIKNETLSEDNIEVLFDIYKTSLFRHPYLNPYNLYRRKLNLGFKLKLLLFKDQGYVAYISQRFLFNTYLLPGIIDSLESYIDIYSFLKRKFVYNISNIIHFYINSKELLDIYMREFRSLDQDIFIDVIYDSNVRLNKAQRHRIHINLKKAIQNGIKVRFIQHLESDSFREWYNNCYTYAYDNEPPFTYSQLYEYTQYLLEHDLEKFTIAEVDGKILGGIGILMDQYSNIAWYNLGAICKEGREKGAGYLLMNTAIEVVRENGKIFELYGKSKFDQDSKHVGIFEFKKIFGREVEIPYYSSNNFIVKLLRLFSALKR